MHLLTNVHKNQSHFMIYSDQQFFIQAATLSDLKTVVKFDNGWICYFKYLKNVCLYSSNMIHTEFYTTDGNSSVSWRSLFMNIWTSVVLKLFYYKMSWGMTKPTKWPVCPAKIQISLGICPVWSELSMYAQWVAKDPMFLHVNSKDFDRTGWMPRLIWVFAGRTGHFVGFVVHRLKYVNKHPLRGSRPHRGDRVHRKWMHQFKTNYFKVKQFSPEIRVHIPYFNLKIGTSMYLLRFFTSAHKTYLTHFCLTHGVDRHHLLISWDDTHILPLTKK